MANVQMRQMHEAHQWWLWHVMNAQNITEQQWSLYMSYLEKEQSRGDSQQRRAQKFEERASKKVHPQFTSIEPMEQSRFEEKPHGRDVSTGAAEDLVQTEIIQISRHSAMNEVCEVSDQNVELQHDRQVTINVEEEKSRIVEGRMRLTQLKREARLKKIYRLERENEKKLRRARNKDAFLVSEVLRICSLSPFKSLTYARSLLFYSLDPITPSWNHVIRGYSGTPTPKEAILVFLEMKRRGVIGNEHTYPFLFKACATLSALKIGKQIQVVVMKNGVDSNVYVGNTMISFYASCGELRDARRVFVSMSWRTVVSWNGVMTACVENSVLDECVEVFAEMRKCRLEPDETTLVIVLSACAELGNLSLGRWIHSQVIEKGLVMNCKLGTALVDMYAKSGELHYARLVFNRMVERNVWTWSAMILGLAQHGSAKEALKLFADMNFFGIKPNHVTFLGVLCACSHAQIVDEGYRVFHDMIHIHGIKPIMMHYGAMVDILSRSGRLEEAYSFIVDMPIEPDPVVWRTLLSACNIHDVNNNTGVLLKVRKRLLELEPKRGGNLVMVANMYAEVGSWEEAAIVRREMKDRGLKKMAGESCVEVGGLVHKFFSGVDNQVDCEGMIYESLDGLNLHMKTIHCDLICFICTL
ncbi:hypothetical protein IFM89_031310 [Coptis chinensis]|uniref:Pentatricopeptide repeat-containing protein n=1 Tax=Coptis chinensis TaxID=261450 RepID=A0A835MB61_9MAGN|nr:hypothetical protein IFM89_031310 [Coptis chinensis]